MEEDRKHECIFTVFIAAKVLMQYYKEKNIFMIVYMLVYLLHT